MLPDPHHLSAQVRTGGRNRFPVIRDTIGKETYLAPNFGELPDHLLAQSLEPAAKSGYRLKDKLEACAELLHDRTDLAQVL